MKFKGFLLALVAGAFCLSFSGCGLGFKSWLDKSEGYEPEPITKDAQDGDASAQRKLGIILASRQHYAAAYAWFDIAAGQGDADAKKLRSKVSDLMTPEQIEEGKRLSVEYKERYSE